MIQRILNNIVVVLRYDGHRDAILRGDDASGRASSGPGMSAEDLMRFFSISEFRGFDDSDKVEKENILQDPIEFILTVPAFRDFTPFIAPCFRSLVTRKRKRFEMIPLRMTFILLHATRPLEIRKRPLRTAMDIEATADVFETFTVPGRTLQL